MRIEHIYEDADNDNGTGLFKAPQQRRQWVHAPKPFYVCLVCMPHVCEPHHKSSKLLNNSKDNGWTPQRGCFPHSAKINKNAFPRAKKIKNKK